MVVDNVTYHLDRETCIEARDKARALNEPHNLARPAESLVIEKAVIAAKSADGLAFLLNKRQRRMPTHSITELLQFAVNRVLSQGWLECSGSRKMSMSSEKRSIRFHPFARLVPTLKMTLSPLVVAITRRPPSRNSLSR